MAPIAAGVAAGIGAGASMLGGIISPIITGEYNEQQAALDREFQAAENQKNRLFNSSEARIDRTFQREMRDTSFISAVNQAKKLGISPSLLLGDQSNQLGGSKASTTGTGGSKASLSGVGNPLNSVAETINKVLEQQHQRELAEDRQAHQRELQENKLEHLENLQILKNNLKMSNSSTSKQAQKHEYTQKELDNLFTDLDKVEI